MAAIFCISCYGTRELVNTKTQRADPFPRLSMLAGTRALVYTVFVNNSQRKLAAHHVPAASDGNRDLRQTQDPYYPICTVGIN